MRVNANIVYSVTRAHACQLVEIHACTFTLYHAFACVFTKITFDWGEGERLLSGGRIGGELNRLLNCTGEGERLLSGGRIGGELNRLLNCTGEGERLLSGGRISSGLDLSSNCIGEYCVVRLLSDVDIAGR
jgi:hypothetical protein